MFLMTADAAGEVCVNMSTGLRFRPGKDGKTGMKTGVNIIFPDGHTNINVRGDYDRLCAVLEAKDAR